MSTEWKAALLPVDSTIEQVIKNLDESALQIVLVVDGSARLMGTITDGDIRRGLLKGLSLGDSVKSIMFTDFLVVTPEMNRDVVLQLMQANRIHQLPIVDATKKVVGLYLLDEILAPSSRDNVFVIMAGGKGKRLLPHTENCPKPLIPVAGKPILEHIIERARSEGFRDFRIAVHYLGHMIEEHFGDGSKWEVKIDYIREEEPLGTAGALALMREMPMEPFLVSNGDLLTDIRYAELLDFHIRHEAIATMAVRSHEWQNPFGVVRTEGVNIVGFEEKPIFRSHVNAGIYCLSPEALPLGQLDGYCDMPTLFTRLIDRGRRAVVYPMHEPWVDVGRPDDLRQLNQKSNH